MSSPSSAVTVRFSPRTVGLFAAVVTVLIWTFFIVYARASADPARGGVLTPFDIMYARLWGAGLVLLPAGWWMVRQARRTDPLAGSLFGLSPLPLRHTVIAGVFGSLLYGMLAYSGFVFAPAAHASVLMPGSLPLWTSLLAIGVLGERISGSRAMGLVCIVAGDLLVGGASLLHALDGSGVWRGDVLFMMASFTWSVYSVTVRRLALEAVRVCRCCRWTRCWLWPKKRVLPAAKGRAKRARSLRCWTRAWTKCTWRTTPLTANSGRR